MCCPPPQKLKRCLPCPRCPVASPSAHVAQPTEEGSSSRGWASGTAEASFFPRMWRLMRHGSTTTTTASAWTSFFCRRTVRRSQPKSWCHRTCMPCNSSAQRVTLAHWEEASSSPHGGALCFPDLGFPPKFVDPARPGASLGVAGCRAQRALCGWLDAQDAGHMELGSACIGCGDPTWRRCWACCVGLCAEFMEAQLHSLWGEAEDAVCHLTK